MSDGNGKVPEWLSKLGVNQYFQESVPRARRAWTSTKLSAAAHRLHEYYGFCTLGFRQELAVKLESGKRIPITPSDACSATNIQLKHWREYHNELEAHGLAEAKGTTKGRIEIRAWALPKDVVLPKIVPARRDNLSWASRDLNTLLKRYRIRFENEIVPARGDIQELERRARVTKDAECSLRAYAEGLCAQGRSNKVATNATNLPINGGAPAAAPSGASVVIEQSAATEEPPPPGPPQQQPAKRATDPWLPVRQFVRQHFGKTIPDWQLNDFVQRCKDRRLGLTPVMLFTVLLYYHEYELNGVRSPWGYVSTQVPEFIRGEGFHEWLQNPSPPSGKKSRDQLVSEGLDKLIQERFHVAGR